MNLCKYKNIFGEVRKGAHYIRIFDFALVDIIGTFLLAYIFAIYFEYNFWKSLLIMFILGIISHRLFCVNTKLDQILFG